MLIWLRQLPITVKVPLVVVAVTMAVSAVISERVLSRLGQLQRDHLSALAEAYLDGLSSSVLPALLREDIWEVFDALDRSRTLYASLRPVETIVTKRDGEVVAASDPDHVPVLSALPAVMRAQFHPGKVAFNDDGTRSFLQRDLRFQERSVGTIYAVLDIAHLVAERRSILRTLIATNSVLAVLFAGLGYLAVNRMVNPLRILADHLEAGLRGHPQPIEERQFPSRGSPFSRLFASYNDLVAAEREREALSARLAEEEKVASLGRLASGMAHEINNPLGGLFNAIDTLKTHGEKPLVRAKSVSLIERGLFGIRDVVRATLATYRNDDAARPLSAQDFQDLRVLLGPELRRRRQSVDWHVSTAPLPELPGNPVRQAVLNLLLNASAASGDVGRLAFSVDVEGRDALRITVSDSGPGMPERAAAILTGDQSYAMLRDGKGLGLWMVRRLTQELGGRIEVNRSPFGGTTVEMRVQATAAQVQADVA